MHMHMTIGASSVRTERLTVLLSPQEKARVAALAQERQTSIGELVRSALATVGERSPGHPDRPQPGQRGAREDEPLSAEQMATLERFAEMALQSMRRANAALDRAFDEAEATKAHLAKTRRRRTTPA
jgi:hypothetical protein